MSQIQCAEHASFTGTQTDAQTGAQTRLEHLIDDARQQVLELLVLGRASDHIGVGPNRRLHLLLKTAKTKSREASGETLRGRNNQEKTKTKKHERTVSPHPPSTPPPQPMRVGALHWA